MDIKGKLHALPPEEVVRIDQKMDSTDKQALLYSKLSDLQLIERYRDLRDSQAEAKAAFAVAVKPSNTRMDLIETTLKARLIDRGAKSIATDAGTAYKSIVTSVQVKDWAAFLEHVIAHEAWFLLERRASKSEIVAAIDDGEELPPGLAMAQRVNLNIKKPVAKPA